MYSFKLGDGTRAIIDGGEWLDGQQRVLLTVKEFRRYSVKIFIVGGVSFSLLMFALGRSSVIHQWF